MNDMRSRVKESGTGKVAKDSEEANYFPADQGPFRCGNCEYFVKPSSCQKVKGKIDPDACCNLFEKDDGDSD